eukprot:CAMPEP_0116574714 /NCGR_PEP_ID=MMETSP0397-20121206/19551_1 /TAXON_ID=216820 /ORGANISM="Cyclophora tenuis, Strain ECT3854" /LENGTH=477 /DNA_ID=CAMNT_0004103517 /DNA_START=1864 /DNA_END=3293 /DNA_ORIENTATION=+
MMKTGNDPLGGSPTHGNDDEEEAQAIMVGTTTSATTKSNMSIGGNDSDNYGNAEAVVDGVEWEKGELQGAEYRDKWFAVAFFVQVMAVAVVAFVIGIPNLQKSRQYAVVDDDITSGQDPTQSAGFGFAVFTFIGVAALAAMLFSGLSLFMMHKYATSCVKTAFIASPVLFLIIGLLMLASNDPVAQAFAFFWFFFAVISVCYAYFYWSYVPFASANLHTGLSAVGTHVGLIAVAFAMIVMGSIFSFVWWISVLGLIAGSECFNSDPTQQQQQQPGEDDACQHDFTNIYFFLLLLAYYWTHYALQGITRVTVAGTVGTWWFEPSGMSRPGCCSSAVKDSFFRSVTYSFGSICMGSLVVAVIQTLRQMVRNQRRRNGGILLCIIECLLACLKDIIEYLNDWAYVYVGLYGYGFWDSAKNVYRLFTSRGWTTLLTNSLVVRTLILVNLGVGGLTGIASWIVGVILFGAGAGDGRGGLFFG